MTQACRCVSMAGFDSRHQRQRASLLPFLPSTYTRATTTVDASKTKRENCSESEKYREVILRGNVTGSRDAGCGGARIVKYTQQNW